MNLQHVCVHMIKNGALITAIDGSDAKIFKIDFTEAIEEAKVIDKLTIETEGKQNTFDAFTTSGILRDKLYLLKDHNHLTQVNLSDLKIENTRTF